MILQEYLQEQHNLNNVVGFIGGPQCPDFSVGGKNLGSDGENVRGLVKTAKHREYELKHALADAGFIISDTILKTCID